MRKCLVLDAVTFPRLSLEDLLNPVKKNTHSVVAVCPHFLIIKTLNKKRRFCASLNFKKRVSLDITPLT